MLPLPFITTPHRKPLPPLTAEERELAPRLRRHVEVLADAIGERHVHRRYDNLIAAAVYVEATLRDLGYEPAAQAYRVEPRIGGKTARNIDAEVRGTTRPDEIIVVGAHYDTITSCPGANDNGTGVAAVLEMARALLAWSSSSSSSASSSSSSSSSRPARTVRFVAFVNEEPPYFQTPLMGSRVYAARCRQRAEKIVAMLTPETIGCYSDEPGSQAYPPPLGALFANVGNFIAFVANWRSRALLRQVTKAFQRHTPFPMLAAPVPERITGVGWSDHWSFWQEEYPGIMVTDTAPYRYKHYHHPTDTPDKIDFDRTARVVAGLTAAVRDLAG